MPTSSTAALAALSDTRPFSSKPDRPVVLTLLDSRTLQVPGPRVLATTYALPWLRERFDAVRSGGSTLALSALPGGEPTLLNRLELERDLRQAIEALPEDHTAGRPYTDLRAYVGAAIPAHVDAYLHEVIGYMHRELPQWRRPPAPRPARAEPVKTPTEQKAAYRARVAAAEITSARWWLDGYLDPENDEAPEPGARLSAPDLYARARDAIESLAEDGEPIDDDTPDVLFRLPGPRTFYAVADDVLGARRRSHGVAYYTFPTAPNHAPEATVNRESLESGTTAYREAADEG